MNDTSGTFEAFHLLVPGLSLPGVNNSGGMFRASSTVSNTTAKTALDLVTGDSSAFTDLNAAGFWTNNTEVIDGSQNVTAAQCAATVFKFLTAGTTGSTTNTLGSNGPNSTTTPNTWVSVKLSDGSTGFVPVWK